MMQKRENPKSCDYLFFIKLILIKIFRILKIVC